MPDTAEQKLAALLRILRPAPVAWVAAAREIPRLEREIEHPTDLAGRAGEPTTAPAREAHEPQLRS